MAIVAVGAGLLVGRADNSEDKNRNDDNHGSCNDSQNVNTNGHIKKDSDIDTRNIELSVVSETVLVPIVTLCKLIPNNVAITTATIVNTSSHKIAIMVAVARVLACKE